MFCVVSLVGFDLIIIVIGHTRLGCLDGISGSHVRPGSHRMTNIALSGCSHIHICNCSALTAGLLAVAASRGSSVSYLAAFG